MTTLAAFLISITSSITARVFTSLGIGIVSFAAISAFTSQLTTLINQQYGQITGVPFQLLNLGGVGTSLSIILSAMAVRATLSAIKQFRITS